MWLFWIAVLIVISIIFRLLWKFAAKIEKEEQEEQQWLTYIEQLSQYDPQAAMQWQIMFDQKFK